MKSLYGHDIKRVEEVTKKKTRVIENNDGDIISEDNEMVKRWTEYCNKLYNHLINSDKHREVIVYDNLPILKSEVENAIKNLKKGKSTGVDTIPGELFINGGTQLIDTITELCHKIWDIKEWPDIWSQSLIIPISKKGNLKKCENYITVSLISHARNILLRVILNRLNPMVESILAE